MLNLIRAAEETAYFSRCPTENQDVIQIADDPVARRIAAESARLLDEDD